jgi:hypothetical protein
MFSSTTEAEETIDEILSTQLLMRYVLGMRDISNFTYGVQ